MKKPYVTPDLREKKFQWKDVLDVSHGKSELEEDWKLGD